MNKKCVKLPVVLLLLSVLLISGCSSKNTVSDTVRFINGTYAMLTSANDWDWNLVGGLKKNAANKMIAAQVLDESWEIKDKASADESIDWLLTEGHSVQYLSDIDNYGIASYTREEFDYALGESAEEDVAYFTLLFDAYEKFGEDAIKAWDLCRATQLLGMCYVADYYTYEEALEKSLKVAQTIQQTYQSWEDMAQSYLYGYQYWSDDDVTDASSGSYARTQVYLELKDLEDGPYSVDWNTKLQKEW